VAGRGSWAADGSQSFPFLKLAPMEAWPRKGREIRRRAPVVMATAAVHGHRWVENFPRPREKADERLQRTSASGRTKERGQLRGEPRASGRRSRATHRSPKGRDNIYLEKIYGGWYACATKAFYGEDELTRPPGYGKKQRADPGARSRNG